MYILVIFHNGERMAWASHSKRALNKLVPEVWRERFVEGDRWAWRMHRAGDGWCDGSAEAWRWINDLPESARIVY